MSIPETTPVTIRYVPRHGEPMLLGRGEIDALGIITVTEAAAGQDAYLAETLGELNARANVIIKGPPEPRPAPEAVDLPEPDPEDDPIHASAPPPAEDEPHPGPSKRKVMRGAPDFLVSLKDYGLRVYGFAFEFDETVFDSDPDLAAPEGLPEPGGPKGPVIPGPVEEAPVEVAGKLV